MGFNEKNFQRAQENFQHLAQQLNEFTQWALEELKKRDLELKETQIHLQMAKKQIDLLVGELADAKREIEDLKERLAESGQVIAMPVADQILQEPKPEETYDELMQRASMLQQQMTGSVDSQSRHHSAFSIDLEHTDLSVDASSVTERTVPEKMPSALDQNRQGASMDLQEGYQQDSLVEEEDPNFFASAVAALDRGDRTGVVEFLQESEAVWQAGDQQMVRAYFDLMDQLILAADGYESVVRSALIQMIRFVVEKDQFDAARTFVQLNNGSLESMVMSEQMDSKAFMDMSVLYFRMAMKYEFKRWIRNNRDQKRLQTYVLQESELWNLLYMGLYFEQDEVIKEEVVGLRAKILRPIPEAKLYREYVEATREARNVDEALEQFDDRVAFMRHVDEPIRERVFSMMKEKLQAKASEILQQPEIQPEEAAVPERKPEVAIQSEESQVQTLPKVEEVHFVGGEGRNCPLDETAMTYQEVSLRTFRSKQERDMNQGGGYQKVRLLYCSKCHHYYINQFIRWGIAGFIRVAAADLKEEHQIS